MNPNQGPVGPEKEFKDEALDKKFSYSFTRRELIVLLNVLRPIQLPVGDLRTKILLPLIEEIEKTAIQSITNDDYKQPAQPATEPIDSIKVN